MTQDQALTILKSDRNVFLTGEPGAGKTYTINQFTSWLDEEGTPYAVTASTGIAASHINGITIHSWSGIGIMSNLEEADVNGIRFANFHYNRIKPVRVLILDEVSMLEATFIDDLDKVLKAIHKNQKPFGGIKVVMVGDFFQLPPVSKKGKTRFAFESTAWMQADFKVCYLTEQHRQADPVFTDLLRSMRFGQVTEQHRSLLQSRLSSQESPVHLFTHNADVDAMNDEKLNQIEGTERQYMMSSSGHPKVIETLKRNCLSPETLRLKEGAVAMFTWNKPDRGYVNGSVGIVKKLTFDGPEVELLDGTYVYPEKNTWKQLGSSKEVIASISQYPLRLAWAITVHKSQGMSLDTASIDLSRAFAYGHGYVAISRVRSLEGLHLAGISEEAYKVDPVVLQQDNIFRAGGV